MSSEASIHKSIEIHGKTREVQKLFEQLLAECRDRGFGKDDLFAIHLALEEAFVNAIRHGNQADLDKSVRVEYLVTHKKFDIKIQDQGPGFDPEGVPDPRSENNLYKPCGRGLLLMKSYMDEVKFNETGNCVEMVKYRSEPSAGKIK